jgi:TRAP-type C4-dicarboxylate transport system permease small subunit
MEGIKKLGKVLYRTYMGIGISAMGIMAIGVIFTVIARYFFSLSWKQLDEFLTTLFAFTTFWGLGIAVLEDEHVVIDIIYRSLKPKIKRVMGLLNLLIALIVDLIVCVYSFRYIGMVGDHLSPGMEIPMKYLYGIMPVCFILCAVCLVLKMILLMLGKPGISYVQPGSGSDSAV